MSKPFKLLIFLVFAAMLSCRQVVQDEFAEFKPVPVVNSILVDGMPVKVHISLAEKLDTNQLGFVTNAKIDMFVDGAFAESLAYANSGVYIAKTIVNAQKEYACKVDIPGYELVESSQFIPKKPVIKNIEHINIAGKNEEGTSYPALKITFNNELQSSAFYEVEIRTIRDIRHEVEVRIARMQTIVDPVILNEGLPIPLFSNALINNLTYTLDLNYITGNSSSSNNGPWRTSLYPLVVELRQVSEDYYRYKKQLYLYDQGRLADGIISSMTNANIYSNVSNGYGIFAGYAATVSDTITPNTDGYYE